MPDNRRIRFEVDDSNIKSSFDRIKDSAVSLSREMMSDATRMSSGGRQVIDNLEDQIKLIEKRNELDRQKSVFKERARLDSVLMSPASSDADQKSARDLFGRQMRMVEAQSREDRLQTTLLQEIIDAIREQGRAELAEDRKGIERKVRDWEKGRLGDLTDEDKVKLSEQKRIIDQDRSEKTKPAPLQWLEVAKGMVVASFVNKLSSIPREIASAKDAESIISQMYTAIPVIGDALAAASERHIESHESRNRLLMTVWAMSGINKQIPASVQKVIEDSRKQVGVQKVGEDTVYTMSDHNRVIQNAYQDHLSERWSYVNAGFDQNEFLPIAIQLARTGGTVDNLPSRTRALIDIFKTRGIDMGQLYNMAGYQRYDRARGMDKYGLIGNISQMDAIFESAGINRVRLSESLGIMESLAQTQLGRGLESVNMIQMAQMKSVFEKLGGTFAYTPDVINSIDQSLSSPSNEFQEGLSYKIYSQMQARQGLPATYLGFKRWQEQGIWGSDRMMGELGAIQDVFGQSMYAELAIKERFGLKSFEQARIMMGLKPEDFAGVTGGTEDVLGRMLGGAPEYTTKRERWQAEISEAFIKSMEDGITTAFNQVGQAIASKVSSWKLPFGLGEAIEEMIRGMADPD